MIGSLLKQLFKALGRFIGYHTRRVLRLPQKLLATPPPARIPDPRGGGNGDKNRQIER
jgi:hypothetical protein